MSEAFEDFSNIGLQVLDSELTRRKNLINNFIYSCSHGIRSPLKTMEGLVSLVKDYSGVTAKDWASYVEMLSQSAERMHVIYKQFDELRLNAERPLEPGVIQLNKVGLSVLRSFKDQMAVQPITSRLHVNQKGVFVTDSWRLETILKMLLSNAVNYLDEQKDTHEASIFITASPASCCIQVHDNGIGIAASEQEKIFHLFYRGTQQSTGVGMGLFIARQIIEKLKGTISVRSNLGQGSVFTVWLPNQLI